jgi:tetratricopeptide (TPR) repeat protein
MKKLLLLFLTVNTLQVLHAQDKTIDSLYRELTAAKTDTNMVKSAVLLSSKYSNADSSLLWAEKAFTVARKLKWKKGEALSLDQVAAVFLKVSNYPKALEYLFLALEISEQTGDQDGKIQLLKKVGRVYAREGDYKMALHYFHEIVILCRQANKDERTIYFAIGSAYDHQDKPDSALSYYQRAYEYISSQGDKKSLSGVLSHLGALHDKMQNTQLALSYCRMAVAAFAAYNTSEPGSAYRHMADIFRNHGMKDSAIYYAEKNMQHGLKINSKDMQLESAALLASLYDDATAVKYYRMANELKDSLFNDERSAQIANISFNERQRQNELEKQRQQIITDRKHNIQYAAIAIGLLVFTVFYLIFSHSIVAKEKPVRYIGILSLLMVFEFINLIIHPYVGDFTHHSPLLMLMVMVAIAAMLIPFHHKLEKWVVSKMVERNKKARLTAAKKIIASLDPAEVQDN